MTLDDLRRLDPKNIGNWPVVPKLGVLGILLIVIVGLSYFFDWQNQLEELGSIVETYVANAKPARAVAAR